ncbi:MAG: PAS domain S-box protein [Methylocystis sp.]|uniref:PAS domain-containing protein n=1 Tax=Methylocystis sp. TaxID=1911079 RepID=UPI003DA3A1FB
MDALCSRWPLEASEPGSALLKFRRLDSEIAEDVALSDIKHKLKVIFDAVPDGMIVISESGDILLFSSGAEKLFGYEQNETLDQNVKMLMPSPYREEHDRYLSAFRETGVKKIIGIGREVSGRRKNGGIFPMYLSVGEIWLNRRRFFVGVAHDLTKLKRAEERLLMLSAAIDQRPSAILITDKEGHVEYVNPRVAQLTGYDPDELIGQNLPLRSHDTANDQHLLFWETLKAGRERRGEILGRTKSGDLYWTLETASASRDSQGKITHFIAIRQDITDQKRNKEALSESEERFRHVAEMAGEWLWEQDPQGRCTYSSAAIQDILGFTPEEILGKSYLDLLVEDGDERWIATPTQNGSAVSRQPFNHLVNKYRHKDGRDVYTESTGAPILDEQGRLVKWRGVDHDVTARKAYVDALRVRNRAIESVHVGIVISDALTPDNRNVYVNPALCQMTGPFPFQRNRITPEQCEIFSCRIYKKRCAQIFAGHVLNGG